MFHLNWTFLWLSRGLKSPWLGSFWISVDVPDFFCARRPYFVLVFKIRHRVEGVLFFLMYILTGIISDMFEYTSRCSMQLRKQWNTRPHVRQKTLNHGLQNNYIDARKGWNYMKLWNLCHVCRFWVCSSTDLWVSRSEVRSVTCSWSKELSKSSAGKRSLMLFFLARLVQLLPHLRAFNSWMQSLQSRHMKSMH